jgi:hypothetical protein
MCSICDVAKAVLIVNGDKCCKDCALEDITTCPNCGWETNFTEHSSVSREYHGETQDEEWLTCNHCGKETDEAELQRHRLARMAGIQKQLAELGLA